jgi:uncharacterized protein (TIGR02611 family)
VRMRERLVLDCVRPLLDEDEEVTAWAHVVAEADGDTGVFSVTETRCVLKWDVGAAETPVTTVRWSELHAVAVEHEPTRWPLLRLEGTHGAIRVRLPLSSGARARKASRLLHRIAEHAPPHLTVSGRLRRGRPAEFTADRRGVRGHLRRILVTLAGVLVILVGAVFASPFVPGPGALTTLFGLAILAREYDWAREVHEWMRQKVDAFLQRRRRRKASKDGRVAPHADTPAIPEEPGRAA